MSVHSFPTPTTALITWKQSYLFLRHLFTELRFNPYACEMHASQTIRGLAERGLVKLCVPKDAIAIIDHLFFKFRCKILYPNMQDPAVRCYQISFGDGSWMEIRLQIIEQMNQEAVQNSVARAQLSREGVKMWPDLEVSNIHQAPKWQLSPIIWPKSYGFMKKRGALSLQKQRINRERRSAK